MDVFEECKAKKAKGNVKMLPPWKKSYHKPRQCIKKQRYHFANKHPYSQSYGFSSSLVECESWTIKAEH